MDWELKEEDAKAIAGQLFDFRRSFLTRPDVGPVDGLIRRWMRDWMLM